MIPGGPLALQNPSYLASMSLEGKHMLEWKPRLALLMVLTASVALFLGTLVHISTTGGNFGW